MTWESKIGHNTAHELMAVMWPPLTLTLASIPQNHSNLYWNRSKCLSMLRNRLHFTVMPKARLALGLDPARCGIVPTNLSRVLPTCESLRYSTFFTMTNTDDVWTVGDKYSWTSRSRQSLPYFLFKAWHWGYYSAVSDVVSFLSIGHPWYKMTVQNQWVLLWLVQWDVTNLVPWSAWSVDMGTWLWTLRKTSQWKWGPGRSGSVMYVRITIPDSDLMTSLTQ